jgi:putative chitinase
MKLHQKYKTLFAKNGITTPLRLAHFMAQIEHESNLKPISENLNYSQSGLLKIFGKYFTKETAKLYARKPEQIANIVYANRIGNGPTESGEGWKYRGRGFIQITGKSNYTKLSNDTGIDYVNNPYKLLTEADSLISALWYWKGMKGNLMADHDDIKNITRSINGGYNGLAHREQLLIKWKKYFEV